MRFDELARRIGARLQVPAAAREVARVHGSDTMSDLIAGAAADTLLVTSLNNTQLVRVAELMDVPGICLVGAAEPSPELLTRAAAAGTAILVSPLDLAETVRLLEACLVASRAAPA